MANKVRDRIGNPIFAIETAITSVVVRIRDGRNEEAFELLINMQISIEKIKERLSELEQL
jgi:hypothetical protein